MNAWTVPGYTETRELGSGGSGRVVLAVHGATGTPVAVKYLSERFRRDPAFVREFRAEARLLGGLHSPHVVGLYEYVEAPEGAAIVMELVDGIALRALLAQEGHTGPEAALLVLKGSLLGLAAAHRAGVVHRDYKPENVLVGQDGASKLVDFGIAAGRGTTPGVAGTPAYMAPEQWQGRPASPAADVYAATATFFECLTGRKPYAGENFAELALRHIEAPVPDAEAPEPVRALIRRGLAKAPEDRPENAEAFVAELEAVAAAGYGPDWEERGQRKLAALAALLPLLFPSAAGGAAAGTTALAETALGGGGGGGTWWPGRGGWFATAIAAVTGAVLVFASQAAGGEPGGRAAVSSFATTAASPGGGGPTAQPATPSPSPSASVTGWPSGTPESSPSPSRSGWPPSPAPTWTPTRTPTWTPTWTPLPTPTRTVRPSPSPTPSVTTRPPEPPVRVRSVEVSSFRQTGVAGGEAVVSVATEGRGPVSVTLEWFTSDASGRLGAAEGTDVLTVHGGPLTATHSFTGSGCYWAVRATTRPAAGNGSSVRELLTRRCTIT
ncbi:serine/threonine protein kinase [Streptomyces bambusae]|uniref:serine/threonine-protein kinase n=1 Tax=Streptomyces bambusae TaxID=1550616 RepID=UPI001CFE068C|nr:serine/threonine-protein kinase [Streptomyces bambusae]MCB5166729.1 serine/threonine protein kinase [Streptomyces bambusae]